MDDFQRVTIYLNRGKYKEFKVLLIQRNYPSLSHYIRKVIEYILSQPERFPTIIDDSKT